MGYRYNIFRIVKGHKGVSLHAVMSVRVSERPEVAAAEMLTWLLALGSPSTPL